MDYEPITKGLRDEMAHGSAGNADVVVMEKTDFEAFCDNIDAIHRSLEQENKEMFDFCDRLKASSEYREDVTLYGVDYIPVPLDKDGVPIHVGDVMGYQNFPNAKYTVVGIGEDSFFTHDASGELYEHTASLYSHYRPDTWERIIADAMQAHVNITENMGPLVARCKALCERTREGGE